MAEEIQKTQEPPSYKKKWFILKKRSLLLSLAFLSLIFVAFTTNVFLTRSSTPSHAAIVQRPSPTSSPEISTPTPSPSPNPSPQPTPGITPTPHPLQPFPTTLQAQVATLEAHDRFFYHGNTHLPEIALTFDDGPSPSFTPQILAVLKQYNVKATFFDVGRLVQLYPDLVRQELAAGNTIGNHSWSHPDLPTLSPAEVRTQLQSTSDIILQAIGVRPTFFRPPYGDFNTTVLTTANQFGLSVVLWNDEALDWNLPGTSVIVSRILNSASNGGIILLHDGGGDRNQTVQALPTIIQQLRARHYQFVTMAQLASDNQQLGLAPGRITPTMSIVPTNYSQWSTTLFLWQEKRTWRII